MPLDWDVVELMTGSCFTGAADDGFANDVGTPSPTKRTALYRLFRADGSLLYVGISGHPPTRFSQHRAKVSWWHLVDESRTTIEWFRTRGRALTWERRAIRTEHPEMNKRDKVRVAT